MQVPGDPHWVQVGRSYGLVQHGRIVGLCYWAEAEPALLDGPAGEPIVTEPGWQVVRVEDPQNHVGLDGPPIEPGMEHDELVSATEDALELAARELLSTQARRTD